MIRAVRSLVLATVAVALAIVPSVAHATSTPGDIATSKAAGITYVKSLQQSDGRFATAAGGAQLDWALSALAAAGVAPVDVKKAGGTDDGRGYYRTLLSSGTWPGGTPPVTDYERGALNAYAAGIDPARVAVSQNLIARIASYWQTASPGYWGTTSFFNGTVFGLLALAGSKTQGGAQRVPQVLLDKSIATVRANQHTDGGWTFSKVEGDAKAKATAGDVDMTGAAIAALCAAGVPNSDTAVVDGKNFLKGTLVNATGAFNSMFGANTNSNGWGVQGLNVCGFANQGADFTTAAGKTPIDFLLAQQFVGTNGGWKYLPADVNPNPSASFDALRAVSDAGFTATPPVPSGGAPQWVAEASFSASKSTFSDLALVIDNGTPTLKVCSVAIAPGAATTNLGAAVDAALTASTPASCVTSRTPTSGTGQITMINGTSNSGGSIWKSSIDGSALITASRGTTVHLGDTIYLRYGA